MFAYLGIVALIAISGTQGQEPCLTPSGTQGNCINIYQCRPVLNMLRDSGPMPETNKETLRKTQCGYIENAPKVCCPKKMQMKMPPRVEEPMVTVFPGPPDVTKHPNLKLLDEELCGPLTQTRIIAGNRTTVLEFPWMALIAYKIDGNHTAFKCGGSLISKKYVLTAAHCVTGLDPGMELFGVRLGEHNVNKEIDCDEHKGVKIVCAEKYQDYSYESFHVHSEFNKKKHWNDIALIRIDGEADFKRKNVKPICLPVGDVATLKFKTAIVTGWGRTETGFRSESLLKVRLDIVPNDECAGVYGKSGIKISHKHLCAGGKNRMDSCAGDSGGPLQYPEPIGDEPKYIQYGIVAFGTDSCGVKGYPGVYTRVIYYMDWILDTMTE